ncbi:p012 [Rhizobium phage 16-3]|uniref:tail terminator n=1 Tax=Rhizobium phage 16-3 TaxID=10704 RepID=UPI00017BA58F|nr:tail terminator [Rhizobium phage 16-3]ABF71264.1 p012 [Rhizobium phage 16-3]
MSASAELQKLLFTTLTGTAGVMALAGGVYDRVPADPYKTKTAYVSFGPSDVVDDSADCIISGEHTFQLDVWSKAVGQVEAKRLVDLIYNALHEQSLELTENALAEIRVDFRRVFPDQDPLITHGVVTVTASIEEE